MTEEKKTIVKQKKSRKKRVFTILFFAFLLFCFSFLSVKVQTFWVNKIIKYWTDEVGGEISFSQFYVSPLSGLKFDHLLIKDLQKDTLFFAEQCRIKGSILNYTKERIYLSNIHLKNAYYNLYSINKEDNTNMSFIINALSSPSDTTEESSDFKLFAGQLNIENGRFRYQDFASDSNTTKVIEWGSIHLSQFNLKAENINLINDSIIADLQHLSLREGSGFQIDKLAGALKLSSSLTQLDNATLETPLSKVKMKYYSMKYREWGDYADFIEKVKLKADFKPSLLSMKDIAFFTSTMQGIDIAYRVSGKAWGTINNLKSKNLQLEWGNKFKLNTGVAISGIPEPNEIYLDLKIKNMEVDFNYADQVFKASPTLSNLSIPKRIKNFERLQYKGRITGFINDLVAYGTFSTDNSTIKTDVRYLYEPQTTLHHISGQVEADSLNLSRLYPEEKWFGLTSLKAQMQLSIDTNSNMNGNIKAYVPWTQINHYTYQNLNLSTLIENNVLKSQFEIKDPMLSTHLNFNLDFNAEPIIDLTAQINKVNLSRLHWIPRDSSSLLSLSAQAHFVSTDFDKIQGNIFLDNIYYSEQGEHLLVDSLYLQSVKKDGIRDIQLHSDLFDAHLKGAFLFKHLPALFYSFLNRYLPSADFTKKEKKSNDNQSINLDVNLKNTKDFFNIFYKDLALSENTRMKGHFDSQNNTLNLSLKSNKIHYKGADYHSLNYQIHNQKDSLFSSLNLNNITFSKDLYLNKVSIQQSLKEDSLETFIQWQDTINNTARASILNQLVFYKINSDSLFLNSHFFPSFFYVENNKWNIESSDIGLLNEDISLHHFAVTHNKQYLKLDGTLSKTQNTSIKIQSKDVHLSLFPYLKNLLHIDLDGQLNTDLELLYQDNIPVIHGMLNIDQLKINNQLFGNLSSNTEWISKSNKLMIDLENKLGKKQFTNLKAKGFIDFKHSKIELNTTLNKQKISSITPFVDEYLDHIDGVVSGNINVKGKFNQLDYNGYLDFSRAKFRILYLGTEYNFTDKVYLNKNKILFKNIAVRESNGWGDSATLSGYITHHNFLDMNYFININKKNFMVLNTDIIDNNLFYGQVFMSGITDITGDNDNLKINIVGQTEKNTRFNIPLDESEEASSSQFIKFVSAKGQKDIEKNKYKVDLSDILLNFDLKVTPDAELKLIFNSQLGDVVEARGEGNLNLEINTLGNFKMYGAYTIKKGAYLFTLQNIINKRFDIEQGSYIKWNGDPYMAYVNINAIYKLKASLYELTMNEKDKSRIPVNCYLKMENDLTQPDIKFDIRFPSSGDEANYLIKAMSQDERNKQLLSLLVLNQFDTPSYLKGGAVDNISSGNTVGKTASELLSNQVSTWLSQISDDFDIGLNYRPADEINDSEVELALSTQLFNNRVEIDGNVGVGTYHQTNSNVVGSFNIDVKLNRKGNIRFKGFNRVNDNYLEYNSLYTQGIGLYYKEEFDTFGQLLKKYWKFITFQKLPQEEE